MKDEIGGRFAVNLARVENLIRRYEEIVGDGKGRASVADQDLLRAAVVLLHAALEDLVRSTEEWKLPSASAELLKEIGLPNDPDSEKFTMVDLAAHRGRSVDEVIKRAVIAHLEKTSYNNPGHVRRSLERAGLPAEAVLAPHRSSLAALMNRRHLIAHRADRNLRAGRGHYVALSLGRTTVRSWYDTVAAFGQAVLAQL